MPPGAGFRGPAGPPEATPVSPGCGITRHACSLGFNDRLGQMRVLRRTGPSGLNGGDRNVSLSWCPSCLSDLGKLGWEGTRPGDTRCLPSGPPGGGQTRQKEGQPVWPHWRMRAWWQSGPQGVITGFHLGSFSASSV